MGRVIKREVIAFRCELKSCAAEQPCDPPAGATSTWQQQLPQLEALIRGGWGLVLTPQLRAYCSAHADRVWDCTCHRHPDRAHLCTSHNAGAAELVWDQCTTPEQARFLMGVAV